MKNSRRKFLAGCSTLAVAVGLNPVRVLGGGSAVASGGAGTLNLAAFAEQVNTEFRVVQEGRAATRLRLMEVADLGSAGAGRGPFEQFTLRFAGAGERLAAQETFELRHPRMGRLMMFLVPGSAEDTAPACYTASFSVPVDANPPAMQLS